MSKPFWASTTKWELALHTGSAIVSLLLLVLLENAGRRSGPGLLGELDVDYCLVDALLSRQLLRVQS